MAKRAEVTRLPLSRDRVVRAAITLADEGGIEALTMRRLGQELGVEAMSLYNHVANKEDMLDGILEAVVAEFDLPAESGDWRLAIRATAISANEVLRRHPWAPALLLSRMHDGPARLRFMNSLLGCLRNGGFSPKNTHHAYHVIDGHIVGYTLQQVNFPIADEDLKDVGTNFLEELPADEFPHLVEHIRGHIEGHYEGESGFVFGLDLILEGLERLRDS